MTPAASIIIPAWNSASHIARAVASAAKQTLHEIEIIVVDDGSGDDTRALVDDLAGSDPRIRVLSHAENAGPGAARNTAFEEAEGRWIVPLDADDIMSPERVQALVATAERQRLDLLADNMILFDDASGHARRLAFPVNWMRGDILTLADLLRRDQPFCAPATEFGFAKPILRREFLVRAGLRYPTDIRIGEDFELYVKCLLAGARFGTHPAALYAAAQRPVSLSLDEKGLEHLRRSTERLLALIPHDDEEARALFEERHNALTYAALLHRLKERRVQEGLELLSAIPKPYLARRIAEAASRRLGTRTHPRRHGRDAA